MAAPVFERPELRGRRYVFRDRLHAGEILAGLLADHGETSGLVLAVPAGGVPVALSLARRLVLPCDFLIISKITPRWNTEIGYGAVAFDGSVRLNEHLLPALRLTEDEIQADIRRTRAKVARRVQQLRRSRALPALNGDTAILVDDGLASGFTMEVGVSAARQTGAGRVTVAVPTAHDEAVRRAAGLADAVYCANIRQGQPFAVADAYEEWSDIDDEELQTLIGPG
jgi:putative phosphoribosyl transferase